jgi:hypothetical protein
MSNVERYNNKNNNKNNNKMELVNQLAASNLLPRQYQKNPGNLMWALEYAEALQVPPMTVITGIHVIEGKPTASAQLIGGLARRAGHKLRVRFDRKTMTATAQVVRADDPDFTFESVWTLDRAKGANLTGKGVWKSYPDAMLKARAITEVARDACSEALFGVIYTPEELGAEVVLDAEGEQVPVTDQRRIQVEVSAPLEADPFQLDARGLKNTAFGKLVDRGVERQLAIDVVAACWDAWPLNGQPSFPSSECDEFMALIEEVLNDAPQDAEVVEDDVFTDPDWNETDPPAEEAA